jgi:predicted transcriptional regulator
MSFFVLTPDPVAAAQAEPTNAQSSGRSSPRRQGQFKAQAGALDLPDSHAPLVATALLLAALGLALLLTSGIGSASLGLFLFTRFHRDDVLRHERRAQLFELIRSDPGITFGELRERLGLVSGVAQHHLRLLEQHELVARVREGRTTRYVPRGQRWNPSARLDGTRARIVDELRREPGLTACEISRRLGQRVQSTWEHLRRLQSIQVVASERLGRTFRWRATTPVANAPCAPVAIGLQT